MVNNMLLPVLFLWPMIGAFCGYLIGRKNKTHRNRFADFVVISEFVLFVLCIFRVVRNGDLEFRIPEVLDSGLTLRMDGFRALYCLIAGLMWMMTTVFSAEYLEHYRNRNRYYLFTLITFGATVGVFLSSDLFTTFVFFELMSFTSYVMVVHDETPGAMRAGQTYIAVAILGGMVMLMGLFLLRSMTSTLEIDRLTAICAALPPENRPQLYLAGALILFGFGAKAGMYPLHIWLPKAHPVAPAPASALLSGILTKAGVYGILVLSCRIFLYDCFWGTVILTLGVLTMVTGAVIAVFSINLKRTLACSSVSQIGFILVGIGTQGLLGKHNALAVWGTELHMINHSLIKLVLFMTAGAIYMKLHRLDLNDIRGYGRGKPLLMFLFLCGYLGIAGFPGFNGYISKTLLHEAIIEYIELLEASGRSIIPMKCVEWLFLFSGGLTVAYMTKLFSAIFIERNCSEALQKRYDAINRHYLNPVSTAALTVSSVILPVIGLVPSVFMERMASLGQSFMNGNSPEHSIVWFSGTNLKGAVISIVIGIAVYFGLIRVFLMVKTPESGERKVYVNRWPGKVDIEDSIYRPLCRLLSRISVGISSFFAVLGGKLMPKFCETAMLMISDFSVAFGDIFFPKACEFIAILFSRICSCLPDWITKMMTSTILKKLPVPQEDPSEHEKADLGLNIQFSKETENLLNSFSFGLLMFGLGLCTVLLILII